MPIQHMISLVEIDLDEGQQTAARVWLVTEEVASIHRQAHQVYGRR